MGDKKPIEADGDAFDKTFGPDTSKRGYDEANDYDKEIEKPENVKWDDDAWKGFTKSFADIEKESYAPALKEN